MKTILIIITVLLTSNLVFAQQDSVYSTISNDTVTIWNTDVVENCAVKFSYSVIMLDSNVIVLTETDTVGRTARCICTFDLQYQLTGLSAGHYDVEVHRAFLEKYGYTKDTVIFVGSTSFDIENIFMPPAMTNFIQSPCGGFVDIPMSEMGEFKNFSLSQNYPNPFNPITVIRYQLPVGSWVMLKVYNVLGLEVATLVNEVKKMGSHEVEFDGAKLSGGVYFYRLMSGNFSETKKFVLLK